MSQAYAYDTALADDPCHFGNALGRVWNKENHQRHDCHVERVVVERLLVSDDCFLPSYVVRGPYDLAEVRTSVPR